MSRMKAISITLLAALLAFQLPLLATTSYVTPTGAGLQNGSSWADAFPAASLQAALDAAIPGDEVWVAAGLYTTTAGSDRSISFHMRPGVGLYGSFAGTETLLSQRTLAGGPTSILSGEIGAPGATDNSYHVIANVGSLDSTSILDGFVVRDANDERPATANEGLGGGIFNDGTNGGHCNPRIRHCLITANQATFGAGIFNSGYLGEASPRIEACIIFQNHAYTGGGAIDNFGLAGIASPTIVNTLLIQNTADLRAGGIYCWGGNNGQASPTLLNCVLAGNSAVDGGGVVCDNLNSSAGNSGNATPHFRNCIVWANTASSGDGPQFFILGTATCEATYTDIDLSGQTGSHVLSGPTTGNLDVDPLFLDTATPSGTDGLWMTSDDGYTLQSLSLCRDAGDNVNLPALDLLLAPRVNNGVVDLGAYEYDAPPLASVHPASAGLPTLAPNPSTGLLRLTGAQAGVPVQLRDAQGRLLRQWPAAEGVQDFSDLPAGIYLVVVNGPDGTIAQRWVKN
jgi:hypothetical protein